ncbi:MAG: c-type cytochrome [Candidatus Poribacteria bacterium]|nr:c-type cytochrome [Candidatus Poribacteria bacterium]
MSTNHRFFCVFIANLVLLSVIVIPVFAQGKKAPAASETGKALYNDKCAHCHGVEGAGDGAGAANLLPRPRDFTKGLYKIRSTGSGQLPTDQDLFDIISKGMPGSSMPAWEGILSEDQRWQIVAHIKTFYDGFEDASPVEIDLSGKVPYSGESVTKGRELYKQLECNACHGAVGRGDGTSAPDLTDEWGFRIWPANLEQKWNYRGGATTEDIFKRFIGGIAGSPMPSFISSFRVGLSDAESARMTELEAKMDSDELADAEQTEYEGLEEKLYAFEDIMLKVEEGEEPTPEEKAKLDVGMKPIFEKSWHIANYVKSLGPEAIPQPAIGDKVLRAQYRPGDLPPIGDEAWNTLESSYFPLVGQVVIEPRQFNPSIDSVTAKSFYNDKEIAFLFTWDDRTKTLPQADEETAEILEDAIAIQFPVKVPQGPTEPKPYFIWGDARRAVYLWHWKVSEPQKITEMNAKGIDKATVQSAASQVQAEGVYEDGRYRLWVKRALTTEDKNDLQFESGVFIPIAFSGWDGANGDVKTKRAISTWYTFVLEPVPSKKRFVYPPLVALISVGVLFALRGAVQRRENGNNI